MTRRKTHAEFVAEVAELVGDEFTVTSMYVNARTKINLKHNECGYIYNVTPNRFISSGTRCPRCNNTERKTTESFKEEVFGLVGNEYEVLGEYVNNGTKIKMKHIKCSNEYNVTPNHFLRGVKCPECAKCLSRNKKTKTTEEFKEEVFDIVGNEYTILGEYKTFKTKIKIEHNTCHHKYEVAPRNFMRGNRCPKCFGSKLKTLKEFEREVFELVKDKYVVLGEYKGAQMSIKMRHNECLHEYEVAPISFLKGIRCPKCKESKGERHIAEYLSEMKIHFVRQHKFDDCRHINRLPFDFAILNSDTSLKCLIEYDGEQHFHAVDIFGGEKTFDAQKLKDAIKTQYCADNNIPLIRIPYWEFDNINEILTKELAKLDVLQEV